MKKLLLILLLTTSIIFSQDKVDINGITLAYNNNLKVLTLVISPASVYTNDSDMDVNIEIHRRYLLRALIDGNIYAMTEPYFQHKGHTKEMGWSFNTTRPYNSKIINSNYIFQFEDLIEGEEYILEVSNVCDNKHVTNKKSVSILIN